MANPIGAAGGIQASEQVSWDGETGQPGLYFQTGVGWRARLPDNSEFTLGAGGGAASIADLYAAGSDPSDSTIEIDNTRGPIVLQKDNIGSSGVEDALVLANTTPATGAGHQSSPTLRFTGSAWDGSAAQDAEALLLLDTDDGPVAQLMIAAGVGSSGPQPIAAFSYDHVFGTTGMTLFGGLTVGGNIQSAGGHIYVEGSTSPNILHSNVADNSNAVGHRFNVKNALSTGGATIARFDEQDNARVSIGRESGGNTYDIILHQSGSALGNPARTTLVQVFDSQLRLYGGSSMSVTGGASGLSVHLGQSSHRWGNVWGAPAPNYKLITEDDDYSANATDCVLSNAGQWSTTRTITLPAAATAGAGKMYILAAVDNDMDVVPTGGDTINSAPGVSLAAPKLAVAISDGVSDWLLYEMAQSI